MTGPVRRGGLPGVLRQVSLYTIAILVSLFVLVPVLYGVIGGFKNNGQLSNNPFGLPSPWIFKNYANILASENFWRPLWNSTYIALATTVLCVGVAAMAGFIFARFAFRGREVLYTTVMVARRHLPAGYLARTLVPLLVCPEKTEWTMVLPGA